MFVKIYLFFHDINTEYMVNCMIKINEIRVDCGYM